MLSALIYYVRVAEGAMHQPTSKLIDRNSQPN